MIPLSVAKRVNQLHSTAIRLVFILSLLLNAEMAELLWPARSVALAATVDRDDAADIGLIRRYFSAVNLTLITGTSGTLDALIAIDFVEHDPQPGCDATRQGHVASLRMLRVVAPGLRFQVLDVFATDGLISALVATIDVTTSSMPGPVVTPARLRSDTEIFRVEGDQIVEHWHEENGPAVSMPMISAEYLANGMKANSDRDTA